MLRLKGYLLMGLCVITLSFGATSAKDTREPITPILPRTDLQGKAEPMTKEGLAGQTTNTKKDKCSAECKGIKLNTCFPIIGNCIGDDEGEDATNAFPTMMGALSKIIVSLILVVCFILIIYAGILWSMDKPKDAKEWIKRVAITILLLGFSGVILRLVNPNFFG